MGPAHFSGCTINDRTILKETMGNVDNVDSGLGEMKNTRYGSNIHGYRGDRLLADDDDGVLQA